ncbi:hypothetical protein [Mediterraneibacter gnavus]|jgi:hypothetical protein|uniref:hypothetical protein n=1 Tax=Mediterraneibacter gnavus TaxID=33038 RepID=UPI00021357A2|nr:hypothetical protein [Mediterraneibacter gnavus]EGN45304.1 hypothetical protein HMPREF0991_02707 [Lachnospiraceae bacterium 2_1_58FAA]
MSEDTKQKLQIVLDLLRKSLIDNGVSMGLSEKKIMFFDTEEYLSTGKFDGFSVDIDSLVK